MLDPHVEESCVAMATSKHGAVPRVAIHPISKIVCSVVRFTRVYMCTHSTDPPHPMYGVNRLTLRICVFSVGALFLSHGYLIMWL